MVFQSIEEARTAGFLPIGGAYFQSHNLHITIYVKQGRYAVVFDGPTAQAKGA